MNAHLVKNERESSEAYILRAGAYEQEGSSVDEYAVLIEGLRAHYDNYELYYMLGLYYRYRNADQAFLCFENALHYCDEPDDAKIIREALEDISDRARVRGTSIVIVSYNDFELCRECLRAIRRYCPKERLEIVVVDNASTDDELKRLLIDQANGDERFILIENNDNEGFPAGCNKGLLAANAENDVFFLNNDAILMPNALFWLKMGLYSDRRNGAAGAVTNCAPSQEVSMESLEPYLKAAPMEDARPLTSISSNLIKTGKKSRSEHSFENTGGADRKTDEDAGGKNTDKADGGAFEEGAVPNSEHRWWRTISLDSAIETSKSYAKDHNVPMWNPIEVRCRLTGFAVMLRREAVRDVMISGNKETDAAQADEKWLFDELFSPGYFEDDDLGVRLCLAGWRQILCHNAFVYHHGGSGFEGKKDAMECSREKFKGKWGFDIWSFTLPEEDKINALLSAIAEHDRKRQAENGETEANGAVGPRLYDRVLRILDISAGMGTTLSAIKYQMPDSFTAGITSVDVFAGLSKYMADDIISGDPELVTFPWPEKSFDYILIGDCDVKAADPEGLLRKLRKYLKEDGQFLNN